MYERYFGLTTRPFALTPDPAFLYPSRQHARALSLLEYGLETQAGFGLLTGDVGSGKTTLTRQLIRQLDRRVTVGLISNTHRGFRSIHPWALSALSIAPADDSEIAVYEALVDTFVATYARGKRTLLIVDEAQNLGRDLLEELRVLSNVNSEKDVVLQVLLVGQPELRRTLARADLRQFAQRISVDFHLRPLDREETGAYILHRVRTAGGRDALFRPEVLGRVHELTGGVPRLINQLCDLTLVYAYAEGLPQVDAGVLDLVLSDRTGAHALPLFGPRSPATGAGRTRAVARGERAEP
jgi:type II secretory pathway predicted ATPase ExeA